MKRRNILFVIWLLAAVWAAAQQGTILDPGVSEELARFRRAAVGDVAYALTFSIPATTEAPVTGEVEISFRRYSNADALLDFQGGLPDSVAVVNGRRCPVAYVNEHIIVPAKAMRHGKNQVRLRFVAADKALNRHADFLYTLFVPDKARSVFPCFDQPDLKATFRLTLEVPRGWEAVSATDGVRRAASAPGREVVDFDVSPLMPTYLFSFVTGRFQLVEAERDGRRLRAYHRETDTAKVAQLPTVFDELALSLRWMEDYTAQPYPFPKYDIVILPGYQFGGMEHPGAVQLTDWEIFLGPTPTPDEEYVRLELLAHETAHMWFGDLVTMRWFNDVWTKEVFANFMAAKVAHVRFPDYDYELNFLKAFQTRALATDRTAGTHPIHQPLDNLNAAGLLYGNIIYQKAPVMMRKLEELTGEEPLRRGLQKYLQRNAFGNATWEDLMAILSAEVPEAGVGAFSRAWVDERGLPTFTTTWRGDTLLLEETDPEGRNRHWPQRFSVGILYGDTLQEVGIEMRSSSEALHVKGRPQAVLPNYSGRGYGRFVYDAAGLSFLMHCWHTLPSGVHRFAALMNLYENVRLGRVTADEAYRAVAAGIGGERNPLVASAACSYAASLALRCSGPGRALAERELLHLAQTHPLPACRRQLLRFLGNNVTEAAVADTLYNIWATEGDTLLAGRDYTDMALRLAVLMPQRWDSIITQQRSRISNADRREEFDFVSRACTPDTAEQHRLALSLLQPSERAVEPWAEDMLRLLCCDVREPHNNAWLLPLLRAVPEVQRTGDIFFPGKWMNALLSAHRSPEAAALVHAFLAEAEEWPSALRGKLLQAADELLEEKP